MTMIDFIKNMVSPPRCIGCGERLSIFDGSSEKAFCNNCRGKWERTKRSMCAGCKRENVECICDSKLVKNARIFSITKFGNDMGCDKLVYTLKRRRNKRAFDFASDELYKRLRAEEALLMTDLGNVIFTNVPRNAKTKNLYGFDHAQRLAVLLSEKTGGEYRRLLARRWGGKAQKKLGEEARQKNAKNRFVFNDKEIIENETVILVDDVLTTGATAAECIKILRENGAGEVMLLVVARSEKKKKK